MLIMINGPNVESKEQNKSGLSWKEPQKFIQELPRDIEITAKPFFA
jgi:hypothetical protein